MKLIINIVKIVTLSILCYIMFSCENTEPIVTTNTKTDTLAITKVFLFNVPLISDTIYIDKQYNIDIRVEIDGYYIDTIKINYNKHILVCDTNIISSKYFYVNNESQSRIDFLIKAVKLENNDTVYLKSKPLFIKSVEHLANKYVYPSADNGKLKLTWKEFDKGHTKKYLIERWVIDNNYNQNSDKKIYYQKYEVDHATFIDDYYVGEEVEYKITIINDEDKKQDIWTYKKSREYSKSSITQNLTGGYKLHFSKCKYFNNFGQYYITDSESSIPILIHSTNQVEDTTLIIPNAKFGDEGRFWIRYLPKQTLEGYSEENWDIYGSYLYVRYGIPSFSYESITVLNDHNIAYTHIGKIFKYNITNNRILNSISTPDADYNHIQSTPDGQYIYAVDQKLNNYTAYFWTEYFSTNSTYQFKYSSIIPTVSNNLLTIMAIPSNYSFSKLAIYDVTNGDLIYTTNYATSGSIPKISPNGDYFFIYDMSFLKLCRYKNNVCEVIASQNTIKEYYLLYGFNRLNNELCYVWDNKKQFSIRNCSDFSIIQSFSLEITSIIDIDYYSNRILGYMNDKIMIYDLNNGDLLQEVPCNISELFFYQNKTILLGNTIYNNQGIKYNLNQ